MDFVRNLIRRTLSPFLIFPISVIIHGTDFGHFRPDHGSFRCKQRALPFPLYSSCSKIDQYPSLRSIREFFFDPLWGIRRSANTFLQGRVVRCGPFEKKPSCPFCMNRDSFNKDSDLVFPNVKVAHEPPERHQPNQSRFRLSRGSVWNLV